MLISLRPSFLTDTPLPSPSKPSIIIYVPHNRPIMSALCDLTNNASDSDSVQDVTTWELMVKTYPLYKQAVSILSGRLFSAPTLPTLQDTLALFKGHPAKDFFDQGARRQHFNEVKLQIESSYKKSKTALSKSWKKPYVAEKLASLVVLYKLEMFDKKKKNENRKPAATRGNKKGGALTRTELRRAFVRLEKLFDPCYNKYIEHEKVELNKKRRTPSLDYQKSGQRLQDVVPFRLDDVDKEECPVCHHKRTMCIESKEETNAYNANARNLAMAGDGDGTFCGKSSKIGCYCFEEGKGCYCQVVFDSHQRFNIALAIRKNEDQVKRLSGASKPNPPDGTTTSLFYNHFHNVMTNNAIRENQINDGRELDEQIQDSAS